MNQIKTFIIIASCIFNLILFTDKSLCADQKYEDCLTKHFCGGHEIKFPFYIRESQPSHCGFPGFNLTCRKVGEYSYPILHIPDNDYVIERFSYENHTLLVYNAAVLTSNMRCLPRIQNWTLESDQFMFVSSVSMLTLFTDCSMKPVPLELSKHRVDYCDNGDRAGWGLAMLSNDENLHSALEDCKVNVKAPVDVHGEHKENTTGDYGELLRRGFFLNWTATNCSECQLTDGICGFDWDKFQFQCFCPDRPHFRWCIPSDPAPENIESPKLKIILGTAIPGAFILLALVIVFLWRGKKWSSVVPSYFLSRNKSSYPSSRTDLEGNSVLGVPIFSYAELEEATKKFDPSKELGDGGFGTVYHGKLKDGREVAVKRLYEHNYKRVDQFRNETEILTRLRHKNLVSLYGCTSRHSRELLLVYEYIPNGTVADHLHGDRMKSNSLTWPIRMNIAIETASALVYLHNSDIIHRDVKTNNILLDTNFCVKVADFGLSRLFPNDVTHVSTAPQGTPGYVDPEYHQCYQLTNKSDVYSFGVVLIELISSMPAVDIGRHRHEINLANLAINRILKSAFNELVDPWLGFETDGSVSRMTTAVAELAFRCLQVEKESRPTMDEVLEALKEIQSGDESKVKKDFDSESANGSRSVRPPPSPETEDAVLLKNRTLLPPSPNSVADVWVSTSTTASISG